MEEQKLSSILDSSSLAKVCQNFTTTVQQPLSQKTSSKHVDFTAVLRGESPKLDYKLAPPQLKKVPRKVPSLIDASKPVLMGERLHQQSNSSAHGDLPMSSYHSTLARKQMKQDSLGEASSSHFTNHLTHTGDLFGSTRKHSHQSALALSTEPSNEGIKMVQRLHNLRLERNRDRLQRISQNRGLGSTKAAYSTSYHNFHAQMLSNLSQVYTVGDRSERKRALCSSELNCKLPALDQRKLVEKPPSILAALCPPEDQHPDMHIKDHQLLLDSILSTNQNPDGCGPVTDSINGSTQVDRANYRGSAMTRGQDISDREMTPGWQFATQIETEEEDVTVAATGLRNHHGLLVSTVGYGEMMQPSMLDPAFEDDRSDPRTPMLRARRTRNQNYNSQERSIQHVLRQQRFASDYQIDKFVRPSGLLKSVDGPAPKALGVKQYAWKGMADYSTGDLRMTHHRDKAFLERCKKREEETKSDNLPCGINDVPGHLYVTSDMSKRSTAQVQHQHIYESLYRSEFNHYQASKDGTNYYLGVVPNTPMRKRQPVSMTKTPTSNTKRSSVDSQVARNSSQGSTESKVNVDSLPADVMHIVIKNHMKRDEHIRQRKENARRIVKEQQLEKQIEVEKKRFYRKQGVPMPEDAEFEQEIKIQAELHLLSQQKRRRDKDRKTREWRQNMLAYLSDMERKEMTEEQEERLEKAIKRFNRMLYNPKSVNNDVAVKKLIKSPRENRKGH